MTRLLCLVVAGALLWPGAQPARAAEVCEGLPELWQTALRPPIDEITREKIEALINDAESLCADGEYEEAETKVANVHELLESDLEQAPEATSN